MARRSMNTGARDGSAGEGLWDRPVLMDLLADLLFLVGGALLAWSIAMSVQTLPVFPLRQVVVTAPLEQVSRAQVEHVARTALNGNFFTVDLAAARAAFERVPWVRSVSVRRLWPDTVELNIEEHRAVAHWTPRDGESRLLNSRGEVFFASLEASLPQLVGPDGTAARVLERYRAFVDALAPTGRAPVLVQLSERDAWQVRLDDGVMLELGRDQPRHPLSERLARYTGGYAAARMAAKGRLPEVGSVDLRYPNGFALRPRAAGQS